MGEPTDTPRLKTDSEAERKPFRHLFQIAALWLDIYLLVKSGSWLAALRTFIAKTKHRVFDPAYFSDQA